METCRLCLRISTRLPTHQIMEGAEIELAVDDGAVEAQSGASNAIHGVEMELKVRLTGTALYAGAGSAEGRAASH